MKVLLVDDDKVRCEQLKSLLLSRVPLIEEDLYIRHCSQDAKQLMRNISFDFLILDVVLPRRNSESSSVSARFGLQLLDDIKKRPNIRKPRKVVGITANVEDIDSFRQEFEHHCEVVIEASNANRQWKLKIIDAIKFELTKMISLHTSKKEIICLSVHGIRTRGAWQQDLKRLIESNVNTVQFENYKYGYFAILSFLIPFLRWVQVRKFKGALFELSKKDAELYIFCHSFGTYIVMNAIDKLIENGVNLNIGKIVLAGSVLKSSYDFSNILNSTNAIIVNDCGCNDNILLLSELFVPNTGMAGRIGFFGLNNSRFSNRFFQGGHSHYFSSDSNFMESNWIPLFFGDLAVEVFDRREDSVIRSEVVEKLCSFLGKLKEIIYISFFSYILYFYFIHSYTY
ncbi:hypothetical protein [Shewanella baltica]|uniref:hypothetical protein n=1 Tax=Shewanella baltica TaxID=62322 RepID=UPI00217EDEBB|nr:hypothetical protein [Shewanella baltica]MCS6191177.1 response regulator [Shewanella baltica]